MRVKLFLILVSNIFMLGVLKILNSLRLYKVMDIIIEQLNVNTDYVESMIGGNNNE